MDSWILACISTIADNLPNNTSFVLIMRLKRLGVWNYAFNLPVEFDSYWL